MKKLIKTAVIIAACVGLCTDVWPRNGTGKEVPAEPVKSAVSAELPMISAPQNALPLEGPDTIWIDGRAYYDIPGFGLVEWSGPGERTEDYTMYESGNKVGIMGGEAETTAIAVPSKLPEEPPKFTGEVIDQTINAMPERSDAPPDYKPSTTAPGDSDARIIP